MKIFIGILLILLIAAAYIGGSYFLVVNCAKAKKEGQFLAEQKDITEYYSNVKPNASMEQTMAALDEFIARIYANRFAVAASMPGGYTDISDIETETKQFAKDVMVKMGIPFRRDISYYIAEDKLVEYITDKCLVHVLDLIRQGVVHVKQ